MPLILRGKCWVFGDDIPNDGGLMPLKYLKKQIYDPKELASHCFETLRPEFGSSAKSGDIVIAGKNFGRGNAHITGFLGLRGLGVGLLTETIPRGSLRCAINAGLPILPECPGLLSTGIQDGDEIEVNFETGELANISQQKRFNYEPLDSELLKIINEGGGTQYVKNVLLSQNKN